MKFSILFLTFFLLLTGIKNIRGQEFSLKLNEKLTLGKEISDSTEYLFANIQDIKPTDSNMILVANGGDNSLRLYNSKDGFFIRKFGHRGRGPGEFHEISSVEITEEGMFVIIDRHQYRVTIFNQTGNLIQTFKLTTKNLTNAQFISEIPQSNNWMIGYRDFLTNHDTGNYFHIYDAELEKKISSHISSFDYFFDSSLPEEYRLSTSPKFHTTQFGIRNLAVTPSIYTGNIAILDISDLSENNIGEKLPDFYELKDWENRRKYFNSDENGLMSVSWRNEHYLFKRKGATLGLIGNRDFLLHFYALFQDEETIPYVHIYSSHGTLLRTISLNETGISFIKNGKIRSVKPLYLDENNRLYVADNYYKGSYPAVRIFETNLEELLEEN
jgi:hypothetical protein